MKRSAVVLLVSMGAATVGLSTLNRAPDCKSDQDKAQNTCYGGGGHGGGSGSGKANAEKTLRGGFGATGEAHASSFHAGGAHGGGE